MRTSTLSLVLLGIAPLASCIRPGLPQTTLSTVIIPHPNKDGQPHPDRRDMDKADFHMPQLTPSGNPHLPSGLPPGFPKPWTKMHAAAITPAPGPASMQPGKHGKHGKDKTRTKKKHHGHKTPKAGGNGPAPTGAPKKAEIRDVQDAKADQDYMNMTKTKKHHHGHKTPQPPAPTAPPKPHANNIRAADQDGKDAKTKKHGHKHHGPKKGSKTGKGAKGPKATPTPGPGGKGGKDNGKGKGKGGSTPPAATGGPARRAV